MRRLILVGVLLLAAGTLALRGERPSQEPKFLGNVLKGRRLFVEKGCVRCHSVLGSGGTIGPDLAEVGRGASFFETLGRLWSHSPGMVQALGREGIEWPTFAAGEMDDLLSYLYYLNYFDSPGDFVRGEAVFRQKGCIRCHMVGSQGGEVGPKLDPYGEQASPVAMVAAMWNHGPNMSLKMKELDVPKPEFRGSDVADLLAYFRGVTVTSGVRREYVAPGDPGEGRELFEKAGCDGCHAVRGVGGGKGEGPDLARADLQRGVSELAGILWNHGPIVWERRKSQDLEILPFRAEEMAHLIAYLYFINYYGAEGDPAAGKGLFQAKGCANCHSTGGAAESTGPDLSKSRAIGRPAGFAAALWNHAPSMLKTAETRILPWPEFRDREMLDLYAFLVGLREADEKE